MFKEESVTISLERYHAMQEQIAEAKGFKDSLVTITESYSGKYSARINSEILDALAIEKAMEHIESGTHELIEAFKFQCWSEDILQRKAEPEEVVNVDAEESAFDIELPDNFGDEPAPF